VVSDGRRDASVAMLMHFHMWFMMVIFYFLLASCRYIEVVSVLVLVLVPLDSVYSYSLLQLVPYRLDSESI
jgi:hypothetical protein